MHGLALRLYRVLLGFLVRQQRHDSERIVMAVSAGEDHWSGLPVESSTSTTNGQQV